MENGIFSGLDWLPTLADAAGNPTITEELLKGVKLGDITYKNHLDGYDQMELLTGQGTVGTPRAILLRWTEAWRPADR